MMAKGYYGVVVKKPSSQYVSVAAYYTSKKDALAHSKKVKNGRGVYYTGTPWLKDGPTLVQTGTKVTASSRRKK